MIRSLVPLALGLALCAAAVAPPAAADALVPETVSTRTLMVTKDRSSVFQLDAPAGQVVIAQPDIAEIVATADRSFYVRGKALGVTNILIYDTGRRLREVIDVNVGYDLPGLRSDLAAVLPGETIKVANVGGGVLLSGEVSNTAAAARAVTIAERYAPKAVSSELQVRSAEQVVLEVRIVEASRTAVKDLGAAVQVQGTTGLFQSGTGLIGNNPPQAGVRFSSILAGNNVDVILQALEEKGVVRTLARPNLAALSGAEASFLAGGEFPYPVPDNLGKVTIEFKPYGVTLKFLPEVKASGLVQLKVAPEVSAIDPRQSLKLGGFEVPALTIRRAATTIEMRPGETFAIAGLFQQEYLNSMRQIPWIGDVPVIGALFKSARWRRSETELLILVTPRMADSAASRALAPAIAEAPEVDVIGMLLAGKVFDQPMQQSVNAATPITPPTPSSKVRR